MKTLIASLYARLARRQPRAPAVRRYQAAALTRLTQGWSAISASANAELRLDLPTLRARARELANNNDYAKKFLQMLETNVVGPDGFLLRSLATKPDRSPDMTDRATLEDAFAVWASAGQCDTSGTLSFADMQRMIIRAVGRDGEALVRRVRDARAPFGYKQQLLDIDRLDTLYNDELPDGRVVIMGVEYDSAGAPLAYHLLTRHPGDYLRGGSNAGGRRERVSAADIFHIYRPDRPEQGRGVPWMHTAMSRLHMLGAYEEAALVAARTGASKMGFFTAPDGDPAPLADGETDQGEFVSDADPGTFGILPKGYEFQPFNPDYPQANYEIFVKACLRGIASGLGVAYNTLANDLEGVNFSSIRSGTLEERDNWMLIQKWFVSAYLVPTFNDWLEAALLKGAINGPTGAPLPAAKLPKFAAHTWAGRRWSWVDPLKDIEASLAAIRAGLNSPQQISAQMGLDLDDVLEELAVANARAKALGLPEYAAPALPAAIPANATPSADAVVKAAEISATALMRAAELTANTQRASAPSAQPIHLELRVDDMRAVAADMIDDLAQHSRTLMTQIREDIAAMPIVIPAPVVNVAAPVVNIEPAAVDVTVEATLPAPEITLDMPARRTDTRIERDALGNIVKATQIETNA